MNHFEKIDQYFNGKRTDDQQEEFEQLVLNNPQFADEVAFYIKAKNVLAEEYRRQQKSQFKDFYKAEKQQAKPGIKSILIKRLAVAASITVIVTLVSFLWLHQKPSPASLADTYITQHWNVLSVQMTAERDSLQKALQLYNNQQHKQAVVLLKKMLQQNPKNAEALKYSGIAHLQTKNYDAAIKQFAILAANGSLKVNPGSFYQAIALIKRDAPGDLKQARNLLRTVISKKMAGEKEARTWLQRLHY